MASCEPIRRKMITEAKGELAALQAVPDTPKDPFKYAEQFNPRQKEIRKTKDRISRLGSGPNNELPGAAGL
jgi:hypothetical protein